MTAQSTPTDRFPNVTSFKDRHGKRRYRFRKAGRPTHYFSSPFGSEEFCDEYEWAFSQVYSPEQSQQIEKYEEYKKGKERRALALLDGTSVIYFIGPERGSVKIGVTSKLLERLAKLQSGHPERLQIFALIRGDREDEQQFHTKFEAARLQGEWFKRTREINQVIKANSIRKWLTDFG